MMIHNCGWVAVSAFQRKPCSSPAASHQVFGCCSNTWTHSGATGWIWKKNPAFHLACSYIMSPSPSFTDVGLRSCAGPGRVKHTAEPVLQVRAVRKIELRVRMSSERRLSWRLVSDTLGRCLQRLPCRFPGHGRRFKFIPSEAETGW